MIEEVKPQSCKRFYCFPEEHQRLILESCMPPVSLRPTTGKNASWGKSLANVYTAFMISTKSFRNICASDSDNESVPYFLKFSSPLAPFLTDTNSFFAERHPPSILQLFCSLLVSLKPMFMLILADRSLSLAFSIWTRPKQDFNRGWNSKFFLPIVSAALFTFPQTIVTLNYFLCSEIENVFTLNLSCQTIARIDFIAHDKNRFPHSLDSPVLGKHALTNNLNQFVNLCPQSRRNCDCAHITDLRN